LDFDESFYILSKWFAGVAAVGCIITYSWLGFALRRDIKANEAEIAKYFAEKDERNKRSDAARSKT